ncbi:MAG: DUF1540 domain-containing protein [Paraclostridium sp.]
MSNPLNCSASSCAHNNGGSCYASSIQVHGASAVTTAETTCASYENKSVAGFTNCAGGCTCAKTNSINCGASNCVHNSSGCCKAESVQINMDNATCDTFRCE